jgi:hypothetical protein
VHEAQLPIGGIDGDPAIIAVSLKKFSFCFHFGMPTSKRSVDNEMRIGERS